MRHESSKRLAQPDSPESFLLKEAFFTHISNASNPTQLQPLTNARGSRWSPEPHEQSAPGKTTLAGKARI